MGSTPGGMDKRTPCYTPADLRIGAFVNVHGRHFFLHDCDEFTRGYYCESLGYASEEMEGINVVEQAALRVPVRLSIYHLSSYQPEAFERGTWSHSQGKSEVCRDFHREYSRCRAPVEVDGKQ